MKPIRTVAAMAGGALSAVLGLLAGAAPASADPVTSSGSLPSASVEVTFSEDTAAPGDMVIATIDVTNTSGAPNDYTYELGSTANSFGDAFELDGCAPAGVCSVSSGGAQLDIAIDDLPPGGRTVNAYLDVKANAVPGIYPLPQSFSGTQNSVFVTPTYRITVQEPGTDIAVGLDATAGPLLGSQITYDLTVANQGPSNATSSRVVVDLPSQVASVTGATPGCAYNNVTDEVTCNTGAIANGDQYAGTFRANLGLLSIGALPATATLTGSNPSDLNPGNNTSSTNCTVVTSLIILCS